MQVRIESVDEARTLLLRAVEEKGADHVYGSVRCVYFQDQPNGVVEPGCIVGHVLSYKGLTSLPGALNTSTVHGLATGGLLEAPDDVLEVLRTAQIAQDDGETWGEAVARGLNVR